MKKFPRFECASEGKNSGKPKKQQDEGTRKNISITEMALMEDIHDPRLRHREVRKEKREMDNQIKIEFSM